MRDVYYNYHRLALDRMYEDQSKPISVITKALQTMDNMNRPAQQHGHTAFFSAKII